MRYFTTESPELYTSSAREEQEEQQEEDWADLGRMVAERVAPEPNMWAEYVPNTGNGQKEDIECNPGPRYQRDIPNILRLLGA